MMKTLNLQKQNMNSFAESRTKSVVQIRVNRTMTIYIEQGQVTIYIE